MNLFSLFLVTGLVLGACCGTSHAQVFSVPSSSSPTGGNGGGGSAGGGGGHPGTGPGTGVTVNNGKGGTVQVATGHGVIAGGNVVQVTKDQQIIVEVIGAKGNNDPTTVNVVTSN